jgi:hypothetical protein
MESVTQPLLYTPYPSPHWTLPHLSSCCYCSCGTYCSYCLNDLTPSHREAVVRREGTWEIEQQQAQPLSLSALKGSGTPVVKASDPLRRNRHRREEEVSEASKGAEGDDHSEETETDSLLPSAPRQTALELMSPVRKHEGLYPGEGPVITELLLRSEPVDAPVSTLVREGIYLSRSTQRLLRDALSQHSVQILRQVWHSIRSSRQEDPALPSALTASLEKIQTPLSLRNPFVDAKGSSTADNWQEVLRSSTAFIESFQRSGLSFLLRSEDSSGANHLLLLDHLTLPLHQTPR